MIKHRLLSFTFYTPHIGVVLFCSQEYVPSKYLRMKSVNFINNVALYSHLYQYFPQTQC